MRPFLLLLVLNLAPVGQAANAAQAEPVGTSRTLSVPVGEIDNTGSKTAIEKTGGSVPDQPGSQTGVSSREAQIQKCMTTLRFDPAAALSIAEQELLVAGAVNNAGTESRLLLCKGDAHKTLGDSEAASEAYLAAVAIAEKAGDRTFLSIETLGSIMAFQEARILRFSTQENFQKAFETGNDLRKLQKLLDKRLLELELAKFESDLLDLKKQAVESENLRRLDALRNEQKQQNLWRQVLVLGSALLALLLILGLRQFYRKRRIRRLSMTDDLTRLPNRQHILTFLSDQAKNTYEEGQPLSVIAFDIDNFKQINERIGHQAADHVIKAVADIANQALRRGDRVGRLGGKEFLVVLPGSPKKPAIDVAERLRRSVEVSEMDRSVQALQASISLGVCEWNAGHESIDALLKRAHGALDEAKRSGRNRVVDK